MKPILVHVHWRWAEHDWPWFYLLKAKGDKIFLRGADYPDGSAKHKGDEVVARLDEICSIIFMEARYL